jgi:glycosyltransferase involved in cell wall biosynthesis
MLRFRRAFRRANPIVLADRARDARQWETAVRHYQTALIRNPRNPPIWVQYGHALKESGSHAAAEAAYRRAIEDDPTAADPYLQLGHVLKLRGRPEEAKDAYLRAFSIDDALPQAVVELAALGYPSEDLPGLTRDMPAPAAADKTKPPAAGLRRVRRKESVITRADRARDLGQWEIAARFYRRALDRNPANPPIWIQYGHAVKEAGQRDAELAYRQALAYDPTVAEYHVQLGHALKLRGRTKAAEAAYLRAFALDPRLPLATQELGGLGWSAQQTRELRVAIGQVEPAASSREITLPDIEELHGAKRHPLDFVGALPPSPRQFRLLYVSGPVNTPSHRYRVTHYVEALTANGIEAEWIAAGEYDKAIDRLRAVSLLVIFRTEFNSEIGRLIDAARRWRVPVVFDVDDYVFEPQIATPEIIDGIRGWSSRDIEGYRSGVRGFRATLLSCQFATFSTRFLLERGEQLGRRAFLLRNGLNGHALRLSSQIEQEHGERPDEGIVRLGYAGGTRTHQKDFAQCAEAVAAVLRENPNCRLVLFRDEREAPFLYTNEFPAFDGIDDQIEWRYFVPFDRAIEEIARFDISLAPLEIGNPFCEAKSDLKYFEASCCGVPTVASATTAFRDTIQPGVTGYLAASEQEWHSALSELVRDSALRRRVGSAALRDVRERHNPTALARAARDSYSEIIKAYRAGMGRADSVLTVTLVLSKNWLERSATAISLMRGLSQLGHDVEIHFAEDAIETVDDIRRDPGLPESVIISSGRDQLRPCDILVANFWQTAFALGDLPGTARSRVYLLSDYEPFLYPMGEEYIAAEQSCRLGLNNIAYGPWVRHQVERELSVAVESIPFFVNKSTYYPDPEVRRSTDRLLVLMRPERSCYLTELAAEAVSLFVTRTAFAGSVEFFGSDMRLDLPFPHVWHGAITADRAAALFREATLGMALSGTNPFPATFEMMACGLPVIDIDYNDKSISYEGCEAVRLARAEPQTLADEMARLFGDAAARGLLAGNAQRFAAQMPDETAAAVQFEQLLRARLAEQQAPAADPNMDPVASVSKHEIGAEPVREVNAAPNGHDPNSCVAREVAPPAARRPLPPQRLRIDWVLNGIDIGGGGTRNILRAAYYLEKFGHDVGLIFNLKGRDADDCRRMVHQHFYPLQGPIRLYDGTFRAADAIIATHWLTVASALAARASVREVMYFVQDFEPFFYPMSTDHILAENTYRLGLYCICSGAWCSERLKAQFGATADSFKFPLDRSVYYPRQRLKQNRNVIFFARPIMPRRCYGLGVSMLREFNRMMPDVEIILYGSALPDASTIDFPVTARGVLPTINDLAQMYSDADLGIALGTTNPSLVPYEMMACGLLVVDLSRPGAELNFGNRTDIALLAKPVPHEMAKQVCALMGDRRQRQARSEAGRRLIEQFPTEEEMARRVEELIVARLASGM